MTRRRADTRACVLDTSLLLSLGKAGALDLLWDHPGYAWRITPLVRDEVTSNPTRAELGQVILDGAVSPVELDTESDREMGLFVEWTGRVDSGEAEAIAVALSREWIVAIEDRYAQRRLTEQSGRGSWINCATLLVDAVEGGRLSVREADAVFTRLDTFPGYRKRGVESVRGLLR